MIKSFQELVETAEKRGPKRVAVAGAEDADVLLALKEARNHQIADPLMAGSEGGIRALAASLDFDLGDIPVFHAGTEEVAARTAVRLVVSNRADLVMKGTVSTAEIVKAVLDKGAGLRTGRFLSHVMVYEIPGFKRFVIVTDAAVNIAPDLNQKIDIVRNAIQVARSLGIMRPKIAALAALEKMNPDMPSTRDAVELTRIGRRGDFGDCIIDGPLALDDALNPETAQKKGVSSPVSGKADILLAHDLESANLLGKSIAYIGRAAYAGVIMGAAIPLIVVGRGSSLFSKLRAIALGVVVVSSTAENA